MCYCLSRAEQDSVVADCVGLPYFETLSNFDYCWRFPRNRAHSNRSVRPSNMSFYWWCHSLEHYQVCSWKMNILATTGRSRLSGGPAIILDWRNVRQILGHRVSITFDWASVRISRSSSDFGNASSKTFVEPFDGRWEVWLGEGAVDVTGVVIRDGDSNTTGTFRKCSVGIRICWRERELIRFDLANGWFKDAVPTFE